MRSDLTLLLEFISIQEESEIINNLESTEYNPGGERNSVKRYGTFKSSIINVCKEVPFFLDNISNKIFENKLVLKKPDSIQVNEYYPGQGIKPHIDSHHNGNLITILSILGHTVLNFIHPKKEKFSIFIPPRSLFQMKDEIRNEWQHSIDEKKFDIVEGVKLERTKRYSIVFRNSLLI